MTREVIVQVLVDALKPLEYVYACWEGGAVAFDRVGCQDHAVKDFLKYRQLIKRIYRSI